MQHADVRVVASGGRARFQFEPVAPLRVGGETGGQHLDGDGAVEAPVTGLVHLAHAAGPNGGEDLVRTQAGTGQRGMRRPRAL